MWDINSVWPSGSVSSTTKSEAASLCRGGTVAISMVLNKGLTPSCRNCVIVNTPGRGGGVLGLAPIDAGTIFPAFFTISTLVT